MARYPQPGTVLLNKYCIESLIGEGGMGAVLKARHLDLEESIAMKVLLPEMAERKDIEQRFLREAKAAVKLKGEHVARIHDVGKLDDPFEGVPYIVMEYLDGADLNAIIKHHGAQEPPVAVDLLLQACEAIAEAHSIGIIHRDIKASNFFITQHDGSAPQLKVLDFGIATAPQGASELTDASSVIGTPAYMAPEQMRAARVADQRSDIWSLGVVLYELLEGKRPFRSDVYSELCLKVGMDPPHEMLQPDVPEALRAVVFKCLEKSVERRYQSVAELAFDLMPFASDPVLARASVETCARLLGRRSSRAFDASRAPDDATPAPMPPKLTTPNQSMAAVSPDPTPAPPKQRSLTPVPGVPVHRTPTSVNAGAGEMSLKPTLAPSTSRRRIVIAASSFLAAAVVGIFVLYLFSGGSGGDDQTAPAKQTVEPMQVEAPPPTPAEPVKPPVSDPPKPVETTLPIKPETVVTPKTTLTPTGTPTPIKVIHGPIVRKGGGPKQGTGSAAPPQKPVKKDKLEPLPVTDDVYGKRQ
jgi:serine/threonine-protein kinase